MASQPLTQFCTYLHSLERFKLSTQELKNLSNRFKAIQPTVQALLLHYAWQALSGNWDEAVNLRTRFNSYAILKTVLVDKELQALRIFRPYMIAAGNSSAVKVLTSSFERTLTAKPAKIPPTLGDQNESHLTVLSASHQETNPTLSMASTKDELSQLFGADGEVVLVTDDLANIILSDGEGEEETETPVKAPVKAPPKPKAPIKAPIKAPVKAPAPLPARKTSLLSEEVVDPFDLSDLLPPVAPAKPAPKPAALVKPVAPAKPAAELAMPSFDEVVQVPVPPVKARAPAAPRARAPAAPRARAPSKASKASGDEGELEKPGQKVETPSESDPLYIFYTTLYAERKSLMAATWLVSRGVFDGEEREELMRVYQELTSH